MRVKNITFIGLNYAPEDTAIGLYSTQWVNFLKEAGYNVTVVTAFPYYPKWEISEEYKQRKTFLKEELNGTTVLRYKQYVPKNPTFLKRIIHLLDFTFGSFRNLYKIKECDLVISVVPFTTSVLLGYIQKKRFKAKLWMHIQDFEFDAALQTGVGKNKNIIFSLLFKLEKWLFSKPDIASTISYSMLKRLSEKTNSEQYFLPNWIDDEKIKKEWILNEVKAFNNVTYYPPVPFEELSDLLCSADVHILFQKPEVIDTVMPSKVLGMMASAKPSIIIGNEKSEVKSIFEASHAGLYFSQYSTDLVKSLESLTADKEKLEKQGERARSYVIENFSKEKILSQMLKRINKL